MMTNFAAIDSNWKDGTSSTETSIHPRSSPTRASPRTTAYEPLSNDGVNKGKYAIKHSLCLITSIYLIIPLITYNETIIYSFFN